MIKMGMLNGLTFQRDLTRIIDMTPTKPCDLSAEALVSLCKTIYFSDESFGLLNDIVFLHFKSLIKSQNDYVP
jgi:hypothetical protein